MEKGGGVFRGKRRRVPFFFLQQIDKTGRCCRCSLHYFAFLKGIKRSSKAKAIRLFHDDDDDVHSP